MSGIIIFHSIGTTITRPTTLVRFEKQFTTSSTPSQIIVTRKTTLVNASPSTIIPSSPIAWYASDSIIQWLIPHSLIKAPFPYRVLDSIIYIVDIFSTWACAGSLDCQSLTLI